MRDTIFFTGSSTLEKVSRFKRVFLLFSTSQLDVNSKDAYHLLIFEYPGAVSGQHPACNGPHLGGRVGQVLIDQIE